MILKASKRMGASELALHLTNDKENDHIDIHELRGFAGNNLEDAFREVEAVSKGTRCKKFLFSLSLSPPAGENVSFNVFESAIDRIELKLGLEGQPRAVVFHEKEGRRHAHCVWSRIDAETMTAIDQPHFKMKLRDVAKQLYLEQGWKMPRGFLDSKERDLGNFNMAEFQQAKRYGEDVRALQETFRECWAVSDNKASFIQILEERGFQLAQGEKRGYIAVDFFGRPYSLTRYCSVKAKEIAAKIGPATNLPAIADVRKSLAEKVDKTLQNHIQKVKAELKEELQPMTKARLAMRNKHRKEREEQKAFHDKRASEENKARSAKLARGLKGIWQRITGKYQKQREENERQKLMADRRDQHEKQQLIIKQMRDREVLQKRVVTVRAEHRTTLDKLRDNGAKYIKLSSKSTTREQRHAEPKGETINRERGRSKDRERER